MEHGSNYALHDDTTRKGENVNMQQSPLVQRHARNSSSGYQPPMAPGVKSEISIPIMTSRIMDRDPQGLRSRGRWNIRREKVEHYWKLYLQDPFHSLIHMRLSKVLSVLTILFIAVLVTFAALYYTVDPDACKTGIYTFTNAFGFSVSTFFTIGFGTNGGDVFFADCVSMQALITIESLVGIMCNAVAIGLIFARFARAQSRANTIVLSSNACVRRIRGDLYFMFQVCEMRKHQLVEAHVRMYTVRHDVEYGQHYYFQSYPMRVQHPDDDKGGFLLLALPSVVVHRLDAWSPLMRPKSAQSCGLHHNPTHSYLFPDVLSRQGDADCGDRDGLVVPNKSAICNTCRCHTTDATPPVADERTHQMIVDDIKKYWEESQLEVVVLIEGIDAVTSATIQVRHSYKAEEMLFDHRFENCVDVHPETGGAVIDFKRFHRTHPVDPECVKVGGAFY